MDQEWNRAFICYSREDSEDARLLIGAARYFAGDCYYEGAIDELRIHDRVLSPRCRRTAALDSHRSASYDGSMKRLRSWVLVLLAFPALAAADGSVGQLMAEGVALHDQGLYEEAVGKYRQALALEPENKELRYELSYSLFAAGEYAACADEALDAAKADNALQGAMFAVAGNCLDLQGKPKKALKAYERGLELEPGLAQLNFNYAITLDKQGRTAEALAPSKRAVGARPDWSSAQILLAQLYAHRGYRVPAILSALRSLATEPATQRTGEMLNLILAQLEVGVTREGGDAEILVNPNESKAEGDFGAVGMLLGMTMVLWDSEEKAGLSASEKLVESVGTALSMVLEASAEGASPPVADNLAFAGALDREGLVAPLLYRSLAALGVEGGEAWAVENRRRIDALEVWLDGE